MSKIYEIDPEADTLVIVRPPPEPYFGAQTSDSHGQLKASRTNGTGAPGEVHIKVSSKHLSLASPYFHDYFATKKQPAQIPFLASPPASPPAPSAAIWGTGKSLFERSSSVPPSALVRESDGVQADGRIHITLDQVDGAATVTVFNIVHGRAGNGRVPKEVSLDGLARIAVVVDRFGLQEAVEIYAERWIDALYRRGLPRGSIGSSKEGERGQSTSLALWLYVSYVFARPDIFQQATRLAATQSSGPLAIPAGLPLRTRIVQDVDAQRQQAVATSLDVLHGAVDALVAGGGGGAEEEGAEASDGDNENDAILLGILVKTLRRSGLAWPRPEAPYDGVSVAAITRAAHHVQTQVWRLVGRSGGASGGKRLLITPKLDALRAGIAGLDLKSDYGYSLY